MNLARILDEAARMYPERPAVRLDELVITYQQLDDLSGRAASWLRERGVVPGDRVGVMLPNVAQFPVLYYGVLRAGGTVVPMNPLLKAREVEHYLGDSGAKLVFAAASAAAEATAGAAAVGAEAVTVEADLLTEIAATPSSPEIAARADDDTAVILYTSGTTGTPKGAELTHANLHRNAVVTTTTLLDLGPDDVIMGCLPLFHAFGQTCALNAAIAAGACLTMVPRFDPAPALKVIERDRVTVFEGVPTMYVAPAARGRRASRTPRRCAWASPAAPRCRSRSCAGSRRPSARRSWRATGCPRPRRWPRSTRRTGAGPARSACRSRAWRSGSSPTTAPRSAEGAVGEIAIRGHNVMKGYWQRPDASMAAIRDGWFHTGDMARRDEDGFYFIVDRKKDMIIRGGFNVYPREIEEVLYEHPAVLEAAVIGVPHPTHGEEVAAAVALRPDAAATPEELRDYVKARVAPYKYPRRVWLVDALPKGPTGKMLKRDIVVPAAINTGGDVVNTDESVEVAAALDLMLTDAALGVGRRFLPGRSTAHLVGALARRPRPTAGRAADLVAELGRIAVGASTVAPSSRDRRFADPAWTRNPALRRVVQAYLATGRTAEGLVADAELDWRDAERIGFLVSNLVQAAAPSNNPLISPVAWKAAIDSGGASVVRGLRNLVGDLAAAPRVPTMVPRDAYRVGVDLAATPGEVVLRTPVFELIQYTPRTETVYGTPLLMVPPTINKYYVMDLAPGRSMIEYFVGQGQQVFVMSWRNPDARHSGWGMDAYGQAVIDALDATCAITGAERDPPARRVLRRDHRVAMVAAHLAALGRDRLASLTLLVTMLDQARAGTAGALVDERDRAGGDRRLAGPRLPGRAGAGRGVRLAAAGRPDLELLGQQLPAGRRAARVRHPVLERRHHPDDRRAAPRLRDARDGQRADQARGRHPPRYRGRPRQGHRRLLRGGGQRRPHLPVAQLLRGHPAARRESRFVLSTNGHIAALVNPPGNPKSSFQVAGEHPADPDAWAADADAEKGSWWPDYTGWLAERSGPRVPAPDALGGARFPTVGAAPGSYVLDT